MGTQTTSPEAFQFERTLSGNIDARKYTLYEVLLDPRLDTLSMDERIQLFNDFIEDANKNNFTQNRRFAQNGSEMERVIFNPTEQSVSRMINFASNNYLNMTNHPSVIAATIKAAETYGTGSGASCITSGRTKIKSDLEQEIADTFESEDALVYPAGFMANVGVLKALLRSNDVAIVDMLAHASIMDGVENRNKLFFQHNDMVSLEKAMIRANQQYANKIRVVAQ